MGPDGLNTLSMGHSNTVHVGEIEVCLTQRSMANDMELGDREAEWVKRPDIKGWHRDGVWEVTGEVFPPLTTDVVGNDDILDPSIDIPCKSRCNSVVNIHVPERRGQ